MRQTLFAIPFAILTATPSLAAGDGAIEGILVGGAVSVTGERSRFDDAGSDLDTLSYNLDAGVTSGLGLYLGAKYLKIQQTVSFTEDSYKSRATLTGYGFAAGMRSEGGLFAQAAWMPSPERVVEDDPSGEATTFKGGRGWVFDAGVLFRLPGVGIGPQVTWTEVTYEDASYGDGTSRSLDGTLYERYFSPMIALMAFL